MSDILPLSWFQRETSEVAYDLIGCVLCKRQPDGQVIRCTISETEAYLGVRDKACHSYNDKRTARTEVMYRHGGTIYVYLIYGMYEMLNIITQTEGVPEGVMIRSAFLDVVEPLLGKSLVLRSESRSLSTTRDALLPKLISGEIRIPDAEKMLEEVGV
jgi:DNA-3-methyladenine glycosylase